MKSGDPFDLDNLLLSGALVKIETAVVGERKAKRVEQFLKVPVPWLEHLEGASGKTYALALVLLWRSWKAHGRPFPLANGLLKIEGVSRRTKWRALVELESRGLISIERRHQKSPLVAIKS